MTTTHQEHYWFAGDDWQLNVTLLDNAGLPFNLSSATVKWALINEAGERVLSEADGSVVVIDAVTGKCAIQMPGTKTSVLAEGKYTDLIRIIYGGITSTLMAGNNWVTADPYHVAAVV